MRWARISSAASRLAEYRAAPSKRITRAASWYRAAANAFRFRFVAFVNPRQEHEWRVWESVKLPNGRKLIPGVISHATNVVEHPGLVAERLVRLAKLVGRDNVMAGTDCGFAQGPFVQRVHPSIMWAKLRSLVEGARLA